MNNLLPIVGIVLLIAAGATFVLPAEVWEPSLTVRLAMAGAGFLALLFSVIGRRQPPE